MTTDRPGQPQRADHAASKLHTALLRWRGGHSEAIDRPDVMVSATGVPRLAQVTVTLTVEEAYRLAHLLYALPIVPPGDPGLPDPDLPAGWIRR